MKKGIILLFAWIALSGCASNGVLIPTESPIPASPEPVAISTEFEVAAEEREPVISVTSTVAMSEEVPECEADCFVFSAVGPQSLNGIYLACDSNQDAVLLLSEDSVEVPLPFEIRDFDVSSDGKRIAIAIGYGSSMDGKGEIVLVDLPDLTVDTIYQANSLLTDVFLLSGNEFVGFVSSHPGYDDIEVLHLASQSSSTVIAGLDLGAGYPVSIRNVESFSGSDQILFQFSKITPELESAERHTAYIADVVCNPESGVCTSGEPSALDWINGKYEHQLSWTSDSNVIDAYRPEEDEEEQIEIRDVSGTLLETIAIPGFPWHEDITQPVSISSDSNSIIFTYGIDDLVFVDAESGAFRRLHQETGLSYVLFGKAQFCK